MRVWRKEGGLGSFLKEVALKLGFDGFGETKLRGDLGPAHEDTGLSGKDFHRQWGPLERS